MHYMDPIRESQTKNHSTVNVNYTIDSLEHKKPDIYDFNIVN
jgi:hypothetical protein